MKIAVVGFSRFVRRRVLPALAQCEQVEVVDLVSRSAHAAEARESTPRFGRLFRTVEEAVRSSAAEVFYISDVNECHERNTRLALEGDRHVIVDKPVSTSFEATCGLLHIASERSLVLAEATNYAFHPALSRARQIFEQRGVEITTAATIFTPPVPAGDHRQCSAEGGGALLDLGPYAASISRVVWPGLRLESVVGFQRRLNEVDLETGFSVMSQLSGDRVLSGHYGFGCEYVNELHLLGAQLSVVVPRAFSIPPEMAVELRVRASNVDSLVVVPPADSMIELVQSVAVDIATKSGDSADVVFRDAVALERIRRSLYLDTSHELADQ